MDSGPSNEPHRRLLLHRSPRRRPESDGTLEWDKTTHGPRRSVRRRGRSGIGYLLCGRRDGQAGGVAPGRASSRGWNAFDIPGAHAAMVRKIRNLGRPGRCVDGHLRGGQCALGFEGQAAWDLAARSARARRGTARAIYGSGGFTSLFRSRSCRNNSAAGRREGIKMRQDEDRPRSRRRIPARVRAAREAIGPDVELFVDANGAYSPQAGARHGGEIRRIRRALVRGTGLRR